MNLRAFLISLLVFALVILVGVYTQRAGHRLEEGFQEIENLQEHSVARYATTVVDTYRYQVRSAQRRLERDSELGKRALTAADGASDGGLLVQSMKEIQRDTGADVVQIADALSPKTWGQGPRLLRAEWRHKAHQGESGFGVATEANEPWLVAYSPVRLYEDNIAILTLGFRMNGRIVKEIADGTGTRVEFSLNPHPNEHILMVPILPGTSLSLRTFGESLRGITHSTQQDVLLWGIACLLCVSILVYGMLEFVFVRRFRGLISVIQSNAEALSRGEVRGTFPRCRGSAGFGKWRNCGRLSRLTRRVSKLSKNESNRNRRQKPWARSLLRWCMISALPWPLFRCVWMTAN